MARHRNIAARAGIARFARDRRGASAVEFAFVAPFMVLLLLGGYATTQGVAISRKVTLTTRALADLISQTAKLDGPGMSIIQAAATQIIAPYDASPLSLRLTSLTITSVQGVTAARVDWSTATNTMKPFSKGVSVQLPTGMPNAIGLSYILSETSYSYVPLVGAQYTGTIPLGDRIFMLPRVSASVTYSGS